FEPINALLKEDIELLKVSLGTPLLYVESITFTENNTPIEYFQSKIQGRFTVDLIKR
ncbi:MAG: UTRA domain-containing protein, partial [Deltaproteobacteria bacterium]|nr:UTRA domain-containing protein [Deltaproteobacteria bacterium]